MQLSASQMQLRPRSGSRATTTAVATPFRRPAPRPDHHQQQQQQEDRRASEFLAYASSAAAPAPIAPVGLAGRSWAGYLASLQRRPLLTKAATAFVLTVVSDSIAQALGSPAPFSLMRACKLGVFGMTVGATAGHYWHRWLDRAILPERPISGLAVAGKVALDQGVFSPIMLTVFLLYVQLLEGRPDFSLFYLQGKVVSTLLASYCVWPAVNVLTFRFVPCDLRILFCNVVGLVWGTYISLSCVN